MPSKKYHNIIIYQNQLIKIPNEMEIKCKIYYHLDKKMIPQNFTEMFTFRVTLFKIMFLLLLKAAFQSRKLIVSTK